jgi:hypothetical protein
MQAKFFIYRNGENGSRKENQNDIQTRSHGENTCGRYKYIYQF